MDVISNFKLIDNLGEYDKVSNVNHLNVFELLPYGISWLCNGNKQEIIYTDKIISLPLQDNSGIALIKSPFSKKDSQAYIINPHGDICFDIGESIRKNERDAIMSDVYYIFNDLFFFFNANGCDYRIQVEPKVGIVGEVILSY